MSKATPRWDLEEALRRAGSADRLLDKYSAKLTPRLDEGTSAQLKADIAALRGASRGGVLGAQKTATANEREIAADAHDLIVLFRNAVKRSANATEELRQAIGVGDDLDPGSTEESSMCSPRSPRTPRR